VAESRGLVLVPITAVVMKEKAELIRTRMVKWRSSE
jgi:hypothetical protein